MISSSIVANISKTPEINYCYFELSSVFSCEKSQRNISKLEIIKKWIDGGLLENSGSKAKKRKGVSWSEKHVNPNAAGSPVDQPFILHCLKLL